MQTFPTRQQIDQAGDLAFDQADRTPAALATLTYRGVPVQLDMLRVDAQLLADLEKRIGRLLEREGWAAPQTAPTAAPAAPPRARRPRVEPEYNHAGDPCCPVHHKPLKEGQYGLYCSAKDDGPDSRNGYCGLKFAE